MTPDFIILADGRHMPIRDDALAVLDLLTAPRIDTRSVFMMGKQLFEVGGIEPLETIIDTAVTQLGRHTAAKLIEIWTAVIEGDDHWTA
jgi:hypothetical protein